ncbi:hypothetical protein [Halorussus ruber]|uniref:hypothetical protein n=1 Tax=Halorussus ruber TaxID=1126238 RepID=UPI001091CFF8|nr:hypothetical protein [Halorussus ruber]
MKTIYSEDGVNGCGADEPFGEAAGKGGFFVTGELVNDSTLTLSGHISTTGKPFTGSALSTPESTEVHLTVAPHGVLEPDKMPEQIETLTDPGPNIWWLAIFRYV